MSRRLDGLMNNAGIRSFAGSANGEAWDAGTFQGIMDINVLGAFALVRACAPHPNRSPPAQRRYQ
ncbi:MAG: SDR family NAD(P)-dependent oxidoreductase [Rubrivivax sp.]